MKLLLIQVGWVSFNNSKAKNPTKYIAGKFELERTGFIHLLLQCFYEKFEITGMKRTLFLALRSQINSELDLLIPNTEPKFALSCYPLWVKLGLWEGFILEKAEVKHMGLNRLEWNCKVLFSTWGKT